MKSLRSFLIPGLAALLLAVGFASVGQVYGPLAAVGLYLAANALPYTFGKLHTLGANTLTNLIPDVYAALDVVSRELTGFIPAVARNSAADRLALNSTLRAFQTPANTAGKDITAAMALPSASDQAIANKTVTLSKARAFPFSWTGEEQRSVDTGAGYLTIQQDQIAQAIRAAVLEIETDLYAVARKGASRAYGTAGTTPFASNLSETAQLRKILDDNGAPPSDRHLIIDTTAGANMRSLAQLQKVNESGDDSMLRQGVLRDINLFAIRESSKITAVTKGTGTGYLVNNAGGYAIGATAITVDTGTGTILAGDVITFAGDANKYVVAAALSANVVTLAAPGLLKAVADNTAITVGNDFTANVGFTRNSLVLATRLPEIPREGDLAIMREVITDPRTNLSFEVAVYPGYRMVTYEIGIVWGVAAIKPEHTAILLG